jgi:hypothetical protein
MDEWIDVNKIFSGLAGSPLHVVNMSIEEVLQKLTELNFKVYRIDGCKILDEKTFFDEVAEVFQFPSYFGHGWAGWDDCLGDFGHLAPSRSAIIWENANQTFAATPQTFLQAICDLNTIAVNAALGLLSPNSKDNKKQIHVFIIR